MGQAFVFLLLDLAGGDLGPQLDDPGQVFHREGGGALVGQTVFLCAELELLALQYSQPLVGALAVGPLQVGFFLCHQIELLLELRQLGLPELGLGVVGGGVQLFLLLEKGGLPAAEFVKGFAGFVIGGRQHDLPLFGDVGKLLVDLHDPGEGLVVEVYVGAGLVDEVNGLVGEEAVRDVPLGHRNGQTAHFGGDGHMVVVLIVGGDTLEDGHGVLKGGFIHHNRLETPLQGGILLNVFAILGKGSGADDLDLAPGEGGLEDIGCAHGALGIAGAHQIVDLVDDQDDVAQLLDLLNESFHPALELPTELGARHQRGEVQQIDLLVQQLVGDVPLRDAQGKPLGNSGLAHAGLADEAGVVFLTAIQDLDHPLQLGVAADDTVQLALLGAVGEGDTVVLQKFPFGRAVLARLFLPLLAGLFPAGSGAAGVGGRRPAEKLIEKGERGGPALVVLVGIAVLLGEKTLHTLSAAKSRHHLVGETFQVLVVDAHLLHHIFHGLDSQFLGALEAETLVFGLSALDACDENHGHVFMASGTKCRLHFVTPFGGWVALHTPSSVAKVAWNCELVMNFV